MPPSKDFEEAKGSWHKSLRLTSYNLEFVYRYATAVPQEQVANVREQRIAHMQLLPYDGHSGTKQDKIVSVLTLLSFLW